MNRPIYPIWLLAALSCLGTKEKARGDSGAIQMFFRLVGSDVRSDSVAWCAAFVGACFERVGIRSTRSLMAKSYLSFGKHISEPRVGAVAVFNRTKDPAFGHVAFVLRWTDSSVYILGGNQTDAVTIERRARSSVVEYRWPSEDPAPTVEFDRALPAILAAEGGWSDHPEDTGGATMKGVTIGRYSEYLGRKATKEELRNISDQELREIYLRYYWFAAWCDLMPWPFNLVNFDTAVNHGPGDAARFGQQAVGAIVDGEIGPNTLDAIAKAGPLEIAEYFKIRERDYRSLRSFPTFGKGWLNRLANLRAYINRFDADAPVRETAEVAEPAPVLEVPAQIEKVEDMKIEAPKWWLNSKTVWGNIIAALSYIVPFIATLFGFPITVDDVQLVGNVGISLIESVGLLIGLAISTYGRFRAVQPIERKPFTFAL